MSAHAKRAALALLLALVTALAVVGGGHEDAAPLQPQATPAPTVTTAVDSGDPGRAPDKTITAPAAAVEQAAEGGHEGAKDETPEGVPASVLDAAREQQDEFAKDDQLPLVTPLAAPEQAGCTSTFVRNYSSRRGVKPRLFVVHYTVSANRPGWSDVNAIVALFNRPAFAASSNYVVDREGHCAYIVRESDKAWTQAAANPVSISVEIVNTGSEGSLISGAGLAKVGRVIADATKRWGIPLQVGKVSGCTVVRPGVVDHKALGACGGGHHDVSPYALAPVLAAAKAARSGSTASALPSLDVLTKGERAAADELLRQRKIAKRHGGWSKVAASHLKAATAAKAALKRANERLHAAAKSSGWERLNRRERHQLIHALI